MVETLRTANRLLRAVVDELGVTFSIMTDLLPVQARRLLRLVAMGAVAVVGARLVGFEDLEAHVTAIVATALQELAHRWLFPATPDGEQAAA